MIRVVCRAPAPQPDPPAGYPRINFLPTIGDCEVFRVDEDGSERMIYGITAIRWEVRGAEPARVWLEARDAIVDVVGKGEVP